MNQSIKYNRLFTYGFFAAILLIYLLFPSHNNSGDAWSYAADAKFGNDLFSPHHLLYTATLYLLKLCIGCKNTIALGMAMNAFFAFLTCLILFQTLKIISNNPIRALLLTAMVAFSFGFWRFATENENYIIPIFFSLSGSCFFVKAYLHKDFRLRNILLSGVFATIACLYHQIHIFWFIGLMVGWIWIDGQASIKRGLIFALTFFIAPFAYFLAIAYYLHENLSFYNIIHFVLHDYFIGSAGNHIGLNNFLLGAINLVRTFFQVHGQIWVMVSGNKLWLIPGILALGLIVYAVVGIFRSKDLTTFKKLSNLNIIIRAHILIFILQLLFALYNIGNAEFMVMLPVLLAIILAGTDMIPLKSLALMAISLLIWNFSYGIYPNNHLHFNADEKVTQFIIDHPGDKFIASEPAIILNQYYYQMGRWPENVWPAPEYFQIHAPLTELSGKIDNVLQKGVDVYTDCNGRPEIMSRASLLNTNRDFFKSYNLKDTVAVYKTEAGKHCIYKILKLKIF